MKKSIIKNTRKEKRSTAALTVVASSQPEQTPAFQLIQEDISDYNFPEEIPGLSLHASRMRRFHDCLDAAIEAHRDIDDDDLFTTAVLERLADGCHLMGLPQAWCCRIATFIPLLGGLENTETINSVFQTAYRREQLKCIPMKFMRLSALLTYKTEAYMKEHYTLRLNVMTGTPEYRLNAEGYLQDILRQKLTDGQTVVLAGIGRFILRVESEGVDDPQSFSLQHHITRIVCGFLPAGRRIAGRRILYDFCDGVETVWQKRDR